MKKAGLPPPDGKTKPAKPKKQFKYIDDYKYVANQIEYVALNYLDQRFKTVKGLSEEDKIAQKIELITYCKELLADEDQQLTIDSNNSMILFLGFYAITLDSIQQLMGLLWGLGSILVSYLALTYMN